MHHLELEIKQAIAQTFKNNICCTLENVDVTINDTLPIKLTDLLFIPIANSNVLSLNGILQENDGLDSQTNQNSFLIGILNAIEQIKGIDLSNAISSIPFKPSKASSGEKLLYLLQEVLNL